MEYREIVAVTGLGGLYQLLTTKSDGAIVRNVADKTTKFISARQHNVTPLESIEVYTTGDNVRLHTVFEKMLEHETSIPLADSKTADSGIIKSYFKSIFPEFDEERVYVSDMKKMLKWYEVLKANDLLHFEAQNKEDAEANAEESGEAAVETPAVEAESVTSIEAPEEKPAKKAKAAKEAEVAETAVAEEEKPKKAAAKKKKAEAPEAEAGETAEEKPAKKTAKKKKTEE